jgi:hypothetical protein
MASAEMISKGGQIEFWQWHGINLAARVAPPVKPPEPTNGAIDTFKELSKSKAY